MAKEKTNNTDKRFTRNERIEFRLKSAEQTIREHFPNTIVATFPTPEGKELLFSTAFVANALGNVKRKIDRGITVEDYMQISKTINEAEKAMLDVCKKILDSGYRANTRSQIDKYVVDRIKYITASGLAPIAEEAELAPAKKTAKS